MVFSLPAKDIKLSYVFATMMNTEKIDDRRYATSQNLSDQANENQKTHWNIPCGERFNLAIYGIANV